MLWILAYPKCHNFYSREARVFRQRHLVVLFSSTSLRVWWLHILTADIVRCYYQSLSRKRVFVFTLSFQGNSFGEQGQKKESVGYPQEKTKKQRIAACSRLCLTLTHAATEKSSFLQLPLIKYWIGSFLQCSSVLSGKRLILSIKVKKEQHTLFLFHPPNVCYVVSKKKNLDCITAKEPSFFQRRGKVVIASNLAFFPF